MRSCYLARMFKVNTEIQHMFVHYTLYVCNFVHIQPNNPDQKNAEQVIFILNLREENDSSMSNVSSQDICFEKNVKKRGGGSSHSVIFTCVAEGESRSRSAVTPSVCPSVRPKILSSQLL